MVEEFPEKTVFSSRVVVPPGPTTFLLRLGHVRLQPALILVAGVESEVAPLTPHVLVVEVGHPTPTGPVPVMKVTCVPD